MNYPINLVVDDDGTQYIVDLNLPGVWRQKGDQRQLLIQGSGRLRQPLNRVRCIAIGRDDKQTYLLLGDSATREVYRVDLPADDQSLPLKLDAAKPLAKGTIGIAMAIAIGEDGYVYVGDAETRSVLRIPAAGGKSELVGRANARAMFFLPDEKNRLLAVTANDPALVVVDTSKQTSRMEIDLTNVQTILSGRPFAYPGGLVLSGDEVLVTDGYDKSVKSIPLSDIQTSLKDNKPLEAKSVVKRFDDSKQGFRHPVGIAAAKETVFVADPHNKRIVKLPNE
ncbi:MAG: hypothetical protein AAFP69_03210 [Planctomycetota bacterium]